MVLARCACVRAGGGAGPERWTRRACAPPRRRLPTGQAGLRVLAVAERRSADPRDGGPEPLVRELTLVGFVGIADGAREGAADAVRRMARPECGPS